MAITNGYITLNEMKSYVGEIPDTVDDPELEAAATSASRLVDRICGRRFYADAVVSPRRFYATSGPYYLRVDDISTSSGLIVKTDNADDGSFGTTWASTDYELEPLNGIVDGLEGWPFTAIRSVEAREFPVDIKRPAVQVTARWGWAAVPAPVAQATMIAATEIFKTRDAAFGVAGWAASGFEIRVRQNPMVKLLLQPYIKGGTAATVA